MNRKATVQIISMSLLFVIGFILTLTMFFFAERIINDFKAKQDLLNQKYQFLGMFFTLQDVIREGYPSQRKIPLSFSTGELKIANNTIIFTSEVEETCFAKPLFESTIGVLSLQTSGVAAYEEADYYVLENDKLRVYFRKFHGMANYSQVIFKIERKDIGVEAKFGRSVALINDYLNSTGLAESQATIGSFLPEATYSLTIRNKFEYQINYTLKACSDYLIISVSCLNCSISKVTYDFVAKIEKGFDDLPYPREGFTFNKNFLCIDDPLISLAVVGLSGDFFVGKVKKVDEYSELKLMSNSKDVLLAFSRRKCESINATDMYIPPCLADYGKSKIKLVLWLKEGEVEENLKLMPGNYIFLIKNAGTLGNITKLKVGVM